MFWKKQKNSIAVEVGDSSIKLLELSFLDEGLSLSASAVVSLEPGIVEKGIIKDKKKLKASVKEVFSMAGVKINKNKEIHFALPDNLVYTHVFRENMGGSKSIKQLVSKEFQKSIPIQLENGEFSYKITDKHGEKEKGALSTVLMVAASKKSLLHWQSFFDEFSISLHFFDIDALAIYRGIFDKRSDESLMIIDVKSTHTKIAIHSSHGLEYDYTSSFRAKDFSKEREDVSTAFVVEIKDLLTFFVDNINSEKIDASELIPKKIILIGENNILEAVFKILDKGLEGSKIEIGKIKYDRTIDSSFFQVLGLAKRSFSHDWENTDPFLPCIGHAYTLEDGNHGDRIHIKEIASNIKTIVFVPIFIIIASAGLWLLFGAVSTSLDSEIEKTSEQAAKKAMENIAVPVIEEKKQQFLKINEIGMPLNVRGGTSTSNKIIGQVNPGSEQVLLKEEFGWYNIEWPNEKNAWVSAEYTTKLE